MLLVKSKTKDEITEFFKNHPKRKHAFVTFTPEGLREAEKAGWLVSMVPAEEAKKRLGLSYSAGTYGIVRWVDLPRGIKKPHALLFPKGTFSERAWAEIQTSLGTITHKRKMHWRNFFRNGDCSGLLDCSPTFPFCA